MTRGGQIAALLSVKKKPSRLGSLYLKQTLMNQLQVLKN